MTMPAGELPRTELPISLRDLPYERVETGNYNQVYISAAPLEEMGCSDGVVVKVARERSLVPPYLDTRRVLRREAAGIALLGTVLSDDARAPFQFPEAIAVDPAGRWAAFKRVAGTVLTPDVVKDFTHDEQVLWGQRIGQVVARVALIDVNEFLRVVDGRYGPCQFNREQRLLEHLGYRDTLQGMGYPQLGEMLVRLRREYEALDEQGLIKPNSIVHNDLHLGNTSFRTTTGNRRIVHGAFDFGNMQFGHAGQDFSFLPYFSETAALAASEAYKDETGRSIPVEAAHFWLRVQIGIFPVQRALAEQPITPDTVEYMQYAFPGPDWEAELIGR